jgi:hypothetical protein
VTKNKADENLDDVNKNPGTKKFISVNPRSIYRNLKDFDKQKRKLTKSRVLSNESDEVEVAFPQDAIKYGFLLGEDWERQRPFIYTPFTDVWGYSADIKTSESLYTDGIFTKLEFKSDGSDEHKELIVETSLGEKAFFSFKEIFGESYYESKYQEEIDKSDGHYVGSKMAVEAYNNVIDKQNSLDIDISEESNEISVSNEGIFKSVLKLPKDVKAYKLGSKVIALSFSPIAKEFLDQKGLSHFSNLNSKSVDVVFFTINKTKDYQNSMVVNFQYSSIDPNQNDQTYTYDKYSSTQQLTVRNESFDMDLSFLYYPLNEAFSGEYEVFHSSNVAGNTLLFSHKKGGKASFLPGRGWGYNSDQIQKIESIEATSYEFIIYTKGNRNFNVKINPFTHFYKAEALKD